MHSGSSWQIVIITSANSYVIMTAKIETTIFWLESKT